MHEAPIAAKRARYARGNGLVSGIPASAPTSRGHPSRAIYYRT